MTRCGFLNERIIANALTNTAEKFPRFGVLGRVAGKQEGTADPREPLADSRVAGQRSKAGQCQRKLMSYISSVPMSRVRRGDPSGVTPIQD